MTKHPLRITVPRVADDVLIRDSVIFEDPDFTNGEPTLCDAEIAFFKENGFLVKRGFLKEKETFERVVDHVWENVPRDLVKRDDPETWIDAPQGEWTSEDSEKAGQFRRGSWKMRSRKIGTEPFLVEKIANHPRMRGSLRGRRSHHRHRHPHQHSW